MASSEEKARRTALRRYAVLDAPSNASFDRITRLAARWFDAPIALLTLVGAGRQEVMSCYGLEAREAPRDAPFYTHTIRADEPTVVEDATEDERFADDPLVTNDLGIRFYVGAPLITPDGFRIGALCVMDPAPRRIDERDALDSLEDLAQIAMDEIERRADPPHTEVLESITDAFFAVDGDWRITSLNRQAEALLDRSREALLGQDLWEAFPEAKELAFYDAYHRAMATGEPADFEAYFPPLQAWFAVKAFPMEQGGLAVYFNDVTAQKKQREQLRRLQRAVEEAAESIIITDAEVDPPGPRIEYVNPAFEEMTGYAAEEVIGQTPRILQGPATDRETLDDVRRHLAAGESVAGRTTVNYRKNGTPFDIEWTIAPICDADGTIQHWVSVQRDVTAEHRRERELRRTRRLLERIIDTANIGICVTDENGRFVRVNSGYTALYGWTEDELIGEPFTKVVPPADRAAAQEAHDLFIYEDVDEATGPWTVQRKDGTRRDALVTAGRLVQDDGTTFKVTTVLDVTERRDMEAALREREALLRSINNHIAEGIYRSTPDGGLVYVNEAFATLFGYDDPAPLLALDDLATLYAQPERRDEMVRKVHEHGAFHGEEVKFRRADGSTFWGLLSARTVYDDDGTVQYRDGAVMDITARKQAEEALREREEYLSITLGSIGDAVITTDPDGAVSEMNAEAQALTGWTHEAARGKPLADIFSIHNAKTGEPVESPVDKVLREGDTVGLANHTVLTSRDGTERQIADSAAPIRAEEGDLLGVVLVFRDVTDKYRRRERIKAERERLEMALAGGDLGMWDWDMTTNEVIYDARWANMLGYALDEVEGTPGFFYQRLHPEDEPRVRAAADACATGASEMMDVEVRMQHKDGSWRWILDRGKVVERDDDGTPRRMVGTHTDITERKQREAALRESQLLLKEAQRIAQVGHFAWDVETGAIDWSDETYRIFGYAPGALDPTIETYFAAIAPDDRDRIRTANEQSLRTGAMQPVEHRIVRPDGTERVVEVRGVTLDTDAAGQPERVVGTVLDITERKRREQQLRRQRNLLEQTQRLAGAWEYDLETGTIDWSDAVYRIHEVPLGTPIHVDDGVRFYAPEGRPTIEAAVERAIDQREAYDLELPLVTAEGNRRWVRTVGAPVVQDDEVVKLAGAFQDVTERKEAEKQLRLQSDILEQVARGEPLDQIFEDLIHAIEMQRPGVIGSLLFYDENNHCVRHGVAPNLPARYNEAIDGVAVGPNAGSCGTAMHERRAVIAEDIATDPRWADYRDLALEHGLRACWSVPILDAGGGVLGSFALYHNAPTTPSAADRALIDHAQSLVGIAIERHRNVEALHEREERVQALYDAMSTLAEAHTPRDLAEVVLSLVTDTLGYAISAIRYVEDDDLVPALVSPACRTAMGARSRYDVQGATAAARAFRMQETLHYDDAEAAGVIKGPGAVRSAAYVPIGTYGTISIGAVEPGMIDPFDVKLLDILAHNAASVLRRIEREDALREARDEAEEMNRLKSAFLANMSHEIRTPLTSIIGFAEVLGEQDLGSASTFTDLIRSSGQRLLDTLNSVLDLSQLEAGSMRLTPESTDVVRTVQVAVDLFTSKTHEKNITLQSDLPEAPVEATLDEAALHRILTNLLSNAVKFTGEGGRIDVRLDPQPTHLVLEIEDTGIGIDEGFVDQLFDAFQQESSGDARAFEGSGLGLTITHRLVELMGGAITVATEKGRGTQFTVRLPYRIEP